MTLLTMMSEKQLYSCPNSKSFSQLCQDCLHYHPHDEKFYNGTNICKEINSCVVVMPKQCICQPVSINKQTEITI